MSRNEIEVEVPLRGLRTLEETEAILDGIDGLVEAKGAQELGRRGMPVGGETADLLGEVEELRRLLETEAVGQNLRVELRVEFTENDEVDA